MASLSSKDPSRPLLRARVKAVFRHLPKGLAGDEEAIHQMRVAGRRLRVALPVLARKPEGKRVRRALGVLRDLARTAGSSRDLDVGVDLFVAGRAEGGTRTPEAAILLRRLRAARARSRLRMAEDLMDLEIARLRRDLRAVLARRADNLFAVRSRLARTRDLGGSALISAIEALGTRFDPDALHRVRIRSRRLRYAAELAEDLRGQSTRAPLLLKELQERLGKVHDHAVLAHWLGQQATLARSARRSRLTAEAQAQQASFLARARRHHREYLECAPATVVRQAMLAMGHPARAVS